MAKALKNVLKSPKKSLLEPIGDSFEWIEARDGYIPDNAIIGGEDINGEPMFVCRAIHNVMTPGPERKKKLPPETSHVLPGKLVPSHGVSYVAFGGREIAYKKYEVLIEKPGMYWSRASADCLLENAIVGSRTAVGEPMFIGRTQHNRDTLVIGYINQQTAELHFPFAGREFITKNFEYLCYEE